MASFLDEKTLTLIQDTAKKSVLQTLVSVPNNPELCLLIGNGTSQEVKTPFVAQPRSHTVESIESFAAAFSRWSADGTDVTSTPTTTSDDEGHSWRQPNIWADLTKNRLLFYVDEPLRRSSITLHLTPSPQLLLLRRFESEQSRDQKSLVRMLRHDLDGCVDPGVLVAFRTIDFQKIANHRATIEHGKQSLDSDIVTQAMGDKKPEAFLVDCPLFAMRELADARTRIGITVDIDCANSKFVLQAKPGHLEMALDDMRAAVLARLENDLIAAGHKDVVILAGSPE